MSDKLEQLVELLQEQFADKLTSCEIARGGAEQEVTIEVAADDWLSVCQTLHDEKDFKFELLVDLCGIDYSKYGSDVNNEAKWDRDRFAVVLHLLSVKRNWRLRVRTFCNDDNRPKIDSVTKIWQSADWFEREAFDLYGILFAGHQDLRRILTDYGFIGHPFRKDFPVTGNVQMRYDEEQKRVIYEPVDIEPRENIPRIIRDDNRYV